MLIETIKKDFMEARKLREQGKNKAVFLSVLIYDIEKVIKDNYFNKDINTEEYDKEVLKIIRKFMKNAEETIVEGTKVGKNVDKSREEIKILLNYLPVQLTEDQLKVIIVDFVNVLPEKTPKMMGKVMSQLKEKYDGQYDNKVASFLVKNSLL